jgi:hypothetical protein
LNLYSHVAVEKGKIMTLMALQMVVDAAYAEAAGVDDGLVIDYTDEDGTVDPELFHHCKSPDKPADAMAYFLAREVEETFVVSRSNGKKQVKTRDKDQLRGAAKALEIAANELLLVAKHLRDASYKA